MQWIRIADMKRMPWKNGQGVTTEIAINPATARFPEDDFSWRISVAEIRAANTFSCFEEHDRLLIIWKGSALIINGERWEPLVPWRFSGKEQIYCDITEGEVLDLGVIYRRGHFHAELAVYKQSATVELGAGAHLIFAARGCPRIEEQRISEGEAIYLEGPARVDLGLESAMVIVVSVSPTR